MRSILAKALLILFIVTPIAGAQSGSSPASTKSDQARKLREERNKKALALIDEIVNEAQSLKLPENRISIEIVLIEVLWEKDEARAVSLLQDAVAGLAELTAAIESGEPTYSNLAHFPQQFRQELLQVIARHDSKMALNFLRSTRPVSGQQPAESRVNLEAQLEMNLATEVAARDPREALRLGQEALNKALNYESASLLYKLQTQDKGLAEKFLGALIDKLRTEDISRNPAATYMISALLGAWTAKNSLGAEGLAAGNQPNISEAVARELSEIVINAFLKKDGSSGSANLPFMFVNYSRHSYRADMLEQLTGVMPAIESLVGGQAEALRRKVAELKKMNEIQQGPWAQYQDIMQNGTSEALLKAAGTAPPEIADNLIQQAVWKTFNEGNEELAHKIAERIADPRQRREIELNIDRQLINRAATEDRNLAAVRALLSRIPSAEERAAFLARMAMTAASVKGDKTSAFEFLSEAEVLLGPQPRSYVQLQAQMQIARAYHEINPAKGVALMERTVAVLNELAAAASVLNGFDLQQYFRNEEFIVTGGNNSLSSAVQEAAMEIGEMAFKDFDRARAVADQFQRREMRIVAMLRMVQRARGGDN